MADVIDYKSCGFERYGRCKYAGLKDMLGTVLCHYEKECEHQLPRNPIQKGKENEI